MKEVYSSRVDSLFLAIRTQNIHTLLYDLLEVWDKPRPQLVSDGGREYDRSRLRFEHTTEPEALLVPSVSPVCL